MQLCAFFSLSVLVVVCRGQLAPVTELSCEGKCHAAYNASLPCECNDRCAHFGNCCPDYNTHCSAASPLASCAGKCNHALDSAAQCQCNHACITHNDCCHDYHTVCTGGSTATSAPQVGQVQTCSSMTVNQVTEQLWTNDVNRLDPSMYTINLQNKVPETNNADHAPQPFFTRVDQNAIDARPTFRAFMALQDNYNPTGGQHDALTLSNVVTEVNAYLDEVMKTSVITTLYNYLKCANVVTDQNDLRQQIHELWFAQYARHTGGTVDSSGFEHVMVGEYKGTNVVNGLHNWMAYYNKERTHAINYYGYVGQASPNLVALNYMWNGHHKELGSFFVGTSPEFDLALFTLCALTHTTHVQLSGHSVQVTTFLLHSPGGLQIASAYPGF